MVRVGRITALVGKNESGKTNALMALEAVKSASGYKLDIEEDYPRELDAAANNDSNVVGTAWEYKRRRDQTYCDNPPNSRNNYGRIRYDSLQQRRAPFCLVWFFGF